MIVPPGRRLPSRSAASIRRTAIRSLIEPPGLNTSSLATSWGVRPAPMRLSRTSGVSPIVSRIESLMSAWGRGMGQATSLQGANSARRLSPTGGHAPPPPPRLLAARSSCSVLGRPPAATPSAPASASRTPRGRHGSRRRARSRTRSARRRDRRRAAAGRRGPDGPQRRRPGPRAARDDGRDALRRAGRARRSPGSTSTPSCSTTPGLEAGVCDARAARWLWCGARLRDDGRRSGSTRSCAGSRPRRVAGARALRRRRAAGADVRHGVRLAAQRARVPGRRLRAVRSAACAAALARRRVAARRRRTWRSTPPTTAGSGSGGWSSTGASCTTTRAAATSPARCRARTGRRARASTRAAWADGAHRWRCRRRTRPGTGRRSRASCGSTTRRRPSRRRCSTAGPTWSPARTRTLCVPLPRGQAAPLVRARVRACRVGGACADVGAASSSARRARALGRAFDGPGEYALRVALEDAAGNVGPFAPPRDAALRRHAAGRARTCRAADRWRAAPRCRSPPRARRRCRASRGYRVRIGGRDAVVATALPLGDLPEGGTPVEVRAVSGAGVESTAVRTLLRLDRTRAGRSAPPASRAASAWSRAPVRGRASRPRPGGVCRASTALGWTIDGGGSAALTATRRGRRRRGRPPPRRLAGARRRGQRLASAAPRRSRSTARRPRRSRSRRRTRPTRRACRVVVADATSGVAGGRVELRRAGAATGAGCRRRSSAGRLIARIDDARLRAAPTSCARWSPTPRATRPSARRRADGAPATVTLPLRRADDGRR